MLASTAIASFAAIALASAAEAQTAPAAQEVVVTGSRISRKDYVADSPIVTVAPAAIENTGSVTLDHLINEVPQFVPGLGGTNNNPGNGQLNIQLRGLGSQRNLVLVDGRRPTPSNVSGIVDINTIPQALIESVEVVTGGQSTTYGSDALAGVVNFKLRHHFTGVQIDTQYGITDQNDGKQDGTTVTMGGNFADDRGNAVLSLGYNNREPVFYGQRANVTVANPTSISASTTDPRILAVSGLSGTRPQGGISFFGSNLPSQAAINALFATYGFNNTPNGTPLIKNTFTLAPNNDGTLFNGPANYRGPTSIDYSTIPGGGVASNGGSYNTGALNYIQLPLTTYNAFAAAEYAITPHMKAYGQFMFTETTSATRLAPSPASGNPTGVASAVGSGGTGFLVASTNPFISADLRTILNSRADPNAPFIFAKRFTDVGARISNFDNTTYQSLVGLKGDVPGYDLTYDIYGSFGHFSSSNLQLGNISHANFAAVLVNPNTAGGGACSTYNPFGISTITASCKSYISPNTKNSTSYTQNIVEANFQGHLITLPKVWEGIGGGDVRFAAGVDYRSDKASFSPDALLSSIDSSTNSYTAGGTTYNLVNNTSGVVGFNGAAPISGGIDVYELYGELLVPLVKDLPFLQSVNLDLGGRFSDYSTIGNAYTYKADIDWKITDWARFRGGYSRAIRAPNVSELFTPATNGFFSIGAANPTQLGSGDPCDINSGARHGVGGVDPAKVRALCLAQGIPNTVIDTFQGANTQVQELSGGNPNLHQERANTYTAGFVFTPHFDIPMLKRVSLSVDWYSIEINGFISSVGPSTQLSLCFNQAPGGNTTYSQSYALCNLFLRDPATGQIISGQANLQNLGVIRTDGIDAQLDWSFRLSEIPALHLSDRLGKLSLNMTASWLSHFYVQSLPGQPFVNNRDSDSSSVGSALPVWKALINATYSVGPIDAGIVERYIGEMRDGSCVGISTACTARGYDPTFYTDLNLRWRVNDVLEVRGGITNAFNQDPRFAATASSSQGQTDASTYDLLGRSYFVALKARF
jgi:outer membrane receptor protein involved in Fe transport